MISQRNINYLRYTEDINLMAESEEEIKSLLMKVKVESIKVGLNLNDQKTKIMPSSPITSWQIYGETKETLTDFILWGSKITADGDCSHEIKRRLLLGRKVITRHGSTDWFQIGKGVCQGCILSCCLFNLYAKYIMQHGRLNEAQAGIKIAGEISITSDMQMTPPLWQKMKRN